MSSALKEVNKITPRQVIDYRFRRLFRWPNTLEGNCLNRRLMSVAVVADREVKFG